MEPAYELGDFPNLGFFLDPLLIYRQLEIGPLLLSFSSLLCESVEGAPAFLLGGFFKF